MKRTMTWMLLGGVLLALNGCYATYKLPPERLDHVKLETKREKYWIKNVYTKDDKRFQFKVYVKIVSDTLYGYPVDKKRYNDEYLKPYRIPNKNLLAIPVEHIRKYGVRKSDPLLTVAVAVGTPFIVGVIGCALEGGCTP